MSPEEAQQRLLVALAARALSDEQLRKLLAADIGDLDPGADLRGALEDLVPAEVEQQVTLMLEANPSMLDDFTTIFLTARLGETPALAPKVHDPPPALPPVTSED